MPSRPPPGTVGRPVAAQTNASVRPTLGKIVVNVDVTIGVILPADNLEKISAEFLRLRGIRELGDLKESSIKKLRLFLKGVKVDVELPGHSGKRHKTIKDIVVDVGKIKFDKGGERTSVADHFAIAHRYTIRPGSLGVKLGSDGLFPMSACKTIQQLYKNRSSPDVVREALEFFPRDPKQRLNAITAGWQQLKYTQSPFLIGAGISVNPQPLSVQGRLLPSPTITFGDSQLAPQRQGTWDVMRRRFIKPAQISAWTVVDFANCDPTVLNRFIADLGMSVIPPHNVVRSLPSSVIAQVLSTAGRAANATMILVILPESAPDPYREVKRFGDITQGVVTQCVKWSRKLASDAQQRRANQYYNNLILKINAKLGGINYMPKNQAMEYLKSTPTMVIGSDVSHPAPGSLLPSISALVASVDERLCKYTASIRVQASRTEIIQDLSEMFKIALTTFYQMHKIYPKRIFVFRDGVSEGEFQTVLSKEVEAMKDVLPETYGKNQADWPELTLIIVGKRHHFRFFGNADAQDPRGNGNLYSGFVVDQDIIHPVYQDFYLQSQPGLKGTSRPSHYTVLRNGSNLSSDALQEIAYALCHCYSRATRSVKIPAPVYYADLVCRRAKFHFSDDVGSVDEMSVTSDEEQHLDYFKQHFSDINTRVKNSMYFV
ncbi:Protein argonaute-2 [Termitomyces sp. T112]|nr:Protein argonaute-2 [Termitomyces sp. T112]